MANKTVIHHNSIGFLGLLALIFITLKLCGVIAWHWVWVLAPLWAIPAIQLLVVVGLLGCAALVAACTLFGVWLTDANSKGKKATKAATLRRQRTQKKCSDSRGAEKSSE